MRALELPLIPLIRAKAIDVDEIVVDAKSGMTGAGRAAKENMLFSEVSEGFHAYGVGVANDRIKGRAIIGSALDNLVKGASGQAMQNMNLLLGFPETMGLEQIALFP